MIIVLGLLYLSSCCVTGFMGRNTVFGFAGHFFLSVLITPLLDFLIQAIGRPNQDMRRKIEKIKE
jgi:uncharacterized membrane protein YhdT